MSSPSDGAAVRLHRWGVALYFRGRTYGVGFDLRCDLPGRLWPIWTGKGDLT